MQRKTQAATSPGDEVVDLREYAAVLLRRIWLLAGVVMLVTGLAAAYSFTRTPVYTAKTVVLVLPASTSTQYRPDQLVSLDTEARVVKSAPVAEIAKETLGSTLTIQELLKHVDVGVTPDELVLDISFSAAGPQQAAAGADAFAAAYLDYQRERSVQAAADERRSIQDKIEELETERDAIEAEIENTTPGTPENDDAERARDSISAQIAILTSQYAAVTPDTNPGEIILPATPPAKPSSPKHVLNIAMGLFLGGFLGVLLAFVRDRTDDRITGRSDFEATIDAPVLATIPHAAVPDRGGKAWLVTERQPRSPAAEAYRTLRTAVMALSRQRELKLFAIVSPTLGEGKSTTTANLATSLSHADSRVLVVTADLRRPSLHVFFQREIGIGLSDVLLGEATLEEATQKVSANLSLLTSGRLPNRPAELLESHRMPEVLASLSAQYDFVLLDCPPVLGLADTLAVAPFVDAVILVARAESSHRGALIHASELLVQVGARVRGGVLNDVSLSKRGAEYGYGYGYGPESEDEGKARPAHERGAGGRERDKGFGVGRGPAAQPEPVGTGDRLAGGGSGSAQPEAGARADQ